MNSDASEVINEYQTDQKVEPVPPLLPATTTPETVVPPLPPTTPETVAPPISPTTPEIVAPPISPTTPEIVAPPLPATTPTSEQTPQTTEPTPEGNILKGEKRKKKLSDTEEEKQQKDFEKLNERIKEEEGNKTKAEEIIKDKELSDKERTNAFKEMLESEKKIESLKNERTEIEERIAGLRPIPRPMRKIMDQVFDEEYRVRTDYIAFEYATKEEEYFKNAIERRKKELRAAKSMNFTEEEIEAVIVGESAVIRDMIQSSLKRKITNDIKKLTIDEIQSNPDKYKEFIDPKTGEVIKSITEKNLTGKILAERVWPKWYPEYLSEKDKTPTPAPIVPPIVPPIPEPTPETTKKEPPWYIKNLGLIGGVAGLGTAVAFGATVGGYAVIGGAVVTLGALGAGKLADWKVSKLSERLAKAETPEEKAKIEKRIQIWNKVKKIADGTMRFARGFGFGAGLGVSISHLFMGGKGLTTMLGSKSSLPPTESAAPSPETTNSTNTPPRGELSESTPRGNIEEPVSEAFTDHQTVQPSIPEVPPLGNTFNSGLSYEQASQLGWGGPNLLLTEAGGFHGTMQGEFFNRIYQGLGSNLSSMQGFNAAQAYNPFLRAVVSGRMGVEEAAKGAIQAIQALP